jgi:DNA polymerase III alpha subunit
LRGFAHLHVRSGFSYGFGVAAPEELVDAAAGAGMWALALTDRDGLYGIPRFLAACEEASVSPIVGAEVSMEEGGHLVLLAEGMAGYRSLSPLVTAYMCSSEDRRRPVCPLQVLLEHAEGLVCLTGAVPFGLLPHLVLSGREKRARKVGRLPKRRRREGQEEIPPAHPASWWVEQEMREGGDAPVGLTIAEDARERMEWEALGLNVWWHPLKPYRAVLRELGVVASEEVKGLAHGSRARAAGLIECLQHPPTRRGHPVWFLLIEDEQGLLQATVFRSVYGRYGHLLHHGGAFLVKGRVEQSLRRGFAFLVERVEDLHARLSGIRVPAPGVVSAPGTFVRARRRGRKAG